MTSYDVTVSYITGIGNLEVEDFAMYPNPSTASSINISVNDPENVDRILIINGSGQILKTERLVEQNNVININNLTQGMYIVKVEYINGQYQMEKLIVK